MKKLNMADESIKEKLEKRAYQSLMDWLTGDTNINASYKDKWGNFYNSPIWCLFNLAGFPLSSTSGHTLRYIAYEKGDTLAIKTTQPDYIIGKGGRNIKSH